MTRSLHVVVVLLALAAVALHSPGQWSFDSVVALGEAQTGVAVGWGSTFFAALLSWLGGGELAGALFVAAMALSSVVILTHLTPAIPAQVKARWIRVVLVWMLVLNPMWWLYVGIVWKDVLLGVAAALSVCLLESASRAVQHRWTWLVAGVAVLAALPLVRQQGVLLTVAIGAVFAVHYILARRDVRRAGIAAGCALALAGLTVGWSTLADRTIVPPDKSPMSVGFLTIMAYDVLGVIARSEGEPAWTAVDPTVVRAIRRDYSPERIDLAWRDPMVAHWIQSRSAESLRELWWAALSGDPQAYAAHRLEVASRLFGFASMRGCLPSYWGVAGPPDVLLRLDVPEAMDPRDRWLGWATETLMDTPILRHWFYVALALTALVALVIRRRWSDAPAWAAIAGSITYSASYLPVSIACDFRYLYPSAVLAVVACLWLLSHPADRAESPTGEPE